MDGVTPVSPAAASRQLTQRELATIRAALRFWQVLSSDEIPEDALALAHGEIGGRPEVLILDDGEIESLLTALAGAGDVVITALEPESDHRRI